MLSSTVVCVCVCVCACLDFTQAAGAVCRRGQGAARRFCLQLWQAAAKEGGTGCGRGAAGPALHHRALSGPSGKGQKASPQAAAAAAQQVTRQHRQAWPTCWLVSLCCHAVTPATTLRINIFCWAGGFVHNVDLIIWLRAWDAGLFCLWDCGCYSGVCLGLSGGLLPHALSGLVTSSSEIHHATTLHNLKQNNPPHPCTNTRTHVLRGCMPGRYVWRLPLQAPARCCPALLSKQLHNQHQHNIWQAQHPLLAFLHMVQLQHLCCQLTRKSSSFKPAIIACAHTYNQVSRH